MTRQELPLHATPEALARAVLRPRPQAPEEVRVFVKEADARRMASELARTFPRVDVVPFQSGHAVLADGCSYLTNGRVSLDPMPSG